MNGLDVDCKFKFEVKSSTTNHGLAGRDNRGQNRTWHDCKESHRSVLSVDWSDDDVLLNAHRYPNIANNQLRIFLYDSIPSYANHNLDTKTSQRCERQSINYAEHLCSIAARYQ